MDSNSRCSSLVFFGLRAEFLKVGLPSSMPASNTHAYLCSKSVCNIDPKNDDLAPLGVNMNAEEGTVHI